MASGKDERVESSDSVVKGVEVTQRKKKVKCFASRRIAMAVLVHAEGHPPGME